MNLLHSGTSCMASSIVETGYLQFLLNLWYTDPGNTGIVM